MPGTADAADAGQRGAAMGEERIDQRPVGMARRRMDDQARRLVDDDQVRVLMDHRKVQGLGLRGRRSRRRYANREALTGADAVGRVPCRAAALVRPAGAHHRLPGHLAGHDEGLDAGPRKIG